MAERGVIIPIGGDASGLDAAIDRAVSSLRSLASSASSAASGGVRQLQSATASAGTAMRRGAVDVERYKDATFALNKAANATGGALTFLTGPLEDVGDLLERGGVRMAAMTVGLVAGAGALYALGSAAVSAAQAIYDTASNASDLLATLEEGGRSVLPAHRDALLEAESATRGLEAETSRLMLTLTAAASGPLVDMVDTVAGFTDGLTRGIGVAQEWAGTISTAIDLVAPRLAALGQFAALLGLAADATASHGRELRAEAEAQAEVVAGNEAWMKAVGAYLDAQDKTTAAVTTTTTAIQSQARAVRQLQAAQEGIVFEDINLGDFLGEESNRAVADAVRLNRELAESIVVVADASGTTVQAINAQQAAVGSLSEQWADHYDRVTRQTQQFAADFAYYSAAGFNIARGFNELTTQSSRKEARKRAAINKAEALVNAGVNTAVAVTKALASAAPPVNIILAALVGALGAVQIGLIAAKPVNTFHRGGLLPDEERLSATSTVVRRNESVGIVTGGGTAAAQRAVSRLNAGEVTSGDTYLLVEGDLFRTRRVAGPNPRYGRGG